MRFYLFVAVFFLSSTLFAEELKPCQIVGFDKVASNTISSGMLPGSLYQRKEITILLKQCIKNYAVCIVEVPPGKMRWLNKYLVEPIISKDFDPTEHHLVFGLLQYIDKNGSGVCMAAGNGFVNVLPWIGASWVVNGDDIREYELREGWQGRDVFQTVMTPKSLYKALLSSHKEAVAMATRSMNEPDKKIDRARRVLKEGYGPLLVSPVRYIGQ